MNFGKIEKVLFLAFYYLDKPEKINWFTKQYNQYFHKDISTQTILYEVAKIKNINPSNNMQSDNNDLQYEDLWKEYIYGEKIEKIKDIYKSFKKGEFIEAIGDSNEPQNKTKLPQIQDIPKDKPEILEESREIVKRDSRVVDNALAFAGYICELECGAELFVVKEGSHAYTEGHHLIPLGYQKEFMHSLDVEANVVSLCPACHRKLHYGVSSEQEIEKLYIERRERLKKCGILVSLEQLLLMYR